MARETSDFIACPACGSRNKTKWEFCAKCGESLAGAEVSAVKPSAPAEVGPPPGGQAVSTIGFVLTLLLIGGGVAYWSSTREEASQAPSGAADVFKIAPAETPMRPAPAASPSPGQVAFEEGRRLLLQGQAAEAAARLAEAVGEASENADYRNWYAKALIQVPRIDDALREFAEAARLAPQNPTYAAEVARALHRAGRLSEAAEAYERALAIGASDLQLLKDAAALFMQAGNAARAVPLLRQAAGAGGSNDLVLQQNLGYALETSGDAAGAVEVYRGVLARLPVADLTRGRLAEALLTLSRPDEAIAVLREGLSLNAASAPLQRGLGSVLERAGRHAEAAAAYREYARLAPNAPDAKQLVERADRIDRSGTNSPS